MIYVILAAVSVALVLSLWKIVLMRKSARDIERQMQEKLNRDTNTIITLDSSGRMLIPRRYMEHAGIKSDVRFNGMDDVIEIWSKQGGDVLLEKQKEAGNILEEMMKEQAF